MKNIMRMPNPTKPTKPPQDSPPPPSHDD